MASSKKTPEPNGDSGLAALLSKIEIELENGNKHKFTEKDLVRAEECLHTNGRVLISFKKAAFDGPGSGSGSGTGTGTGID